MEVIILTGAPGAGKTTISEATCNRLLRSAHVPVDFFRKMVKSGYASPSQWNAEVERQYALARRNAAITAKHLADAGFTVIIDDIVPQKWVSEWRENLGDCDLRLVLLQPRLSTAKERNLAREIWTVEEKIVAGLHEYLAEGNLADLGWIVIDNTTQTVEETVDEIIRRAFMAANRGN